MAVKAVIGLAALAISAFGAIKQGQAANSAAKFEAEQLRQQGIRDREIAVQNSADFRDREARRQATLRARVAGSGTTLEGSPLAVLNDLAAETEFQALRIEAGGDTAANQAGNQGAIRLFEGRAAKQAGFLSAGSSLLTAGSQFGGGSNNLPNIKTDAAGRILGGI